MNSPALTNPPQIWPWRGEPALQVQVGRPAPPDGENGLQPLALLRASGIRLHEVHAVFTLQKIRPSLSCLNEVILTNHSDPSDSECPPTSLLSSLLLMFFLTSVFSGAAFGLSSSVE